MQRKKLQERKLEELNLLDDFLFGSMVGYPKLGERFSRKLLEIIFGRKFGKLTVVAQKMYHGSNLDRHGARLDVYLEEEQEEDEEQSEFRRGEIYDLEPDKRERDKKSLPRRVRFYHAKIDAISLEAGADYDALKNVIIVMITSYDPFGRDRMIYTIRSLCCEDPEMSYDDGARTVFLYTRGTVGNPPEELRQLLKYMEESTKENAKNEDLQEIHRMVEEVKRNGEVSLEYMKIYERERAIREDGIEEGREEERANTERERRRAEEQERRAEEQERRAEEQERRAEEQERRAEKAEEELRKLRERIRETDMESLAAVKAAAKERAIREDGIEEGREEERANTERERRRAEEQERRAEEQERRAEEQERRAEKAEEELRKLREQLREKEMEFFTERRKAEKE